LPPPPRPGAPRAVPPVATVPEAAMRRAQALLQTAGDTDWPAE
jgi:hypothetical protein